MLCCRLGMRLTRDRQAPLRPNFSGERQRLTKLGIKSSGEAHLCCSSGPSPRLDETAFGPPAHRYRFIAIDLSRWARLFGLSCSSDHRHEAEDAEGRLPPFRRVIHTFPNDFFCCGPRRDAPWRPNFRIGDNPPENGYELGDSVQSRISPEKDRRSQVCFSRDRSARRLNK